jgi:TATA-binding protein-associated factor Taf7
MIKHGSKKIRSKLNLNNKMSENKLENLENEIDELIKLSQQLKEVNEHLSKKNSLLSKENNKLSKNLDIAKDGISKIIKKYKN